MKHMTCFITAKILYNADMNKSSLGLQTSMGFNRNQEQLLFKEIVLYFLFHSSSSLTISWLNFMYRQDSQGR